MFETVTSSSKRDLLQNVYTRLVSKARRRTTGTITADDVHAILDSRKYPRSTRNRLSVIRSLLNESLFFSTGTFVPSTREAARGRQIQEWTY